jgi:hypothetical protein
MFSLLKNELRIITRADWALGQLRSAALAASTEGHGGVCGVPESTSFRQISLTPPLSFENGETVEVLISQLVAFLYRYAKGYIKKALGLMLT